MAASEFERRLVIMQNILDALYYGNQCIAFAVRHLPGTDNTGPFASNWHIK